MHKLIVSVFVSLFVVASACADPLPLVSGELSFRSVREWGSSGSVQPENGGLSTPLAGATGIDFIDGFGPSSMSPGVPGNMWNSSGVAWTGDFEAAYPWPRDPWQLGIFCDFTFAGPGRDYSWNPNRIPGFLMMNYGQVNFWLTSISIREQTNTTLILDGTGVVAMPGFDPAPATYYLQVNSEGDGNFNAFTSISTVPEPASLLLLGTGLVGLGRAWRKRKH